MHGMVRVVINRFDRIGRGFTRAAHGRGEMEIVAINDLAPADNLAYLLKYDTVYGRAKFSVSSAEKALVIDGVNVPVLSEKDPAKLPWKDMRVDIVVESTGFFTNAAKAHAHIDAGAKKVVITAPAKGDPSTGSGQANNNLGYTVSLDGGASTSPDELG